MSTHPLDNPKEKVSLATASNSASAGNAGSNNNEVKPRLISIMGPTATGKTDLALWLAQQLQTQTRPVSSSTPKGVALISADSKQVFRGLETISGADVPSSFKRIKAQDSQLKYDYFLDQERTVTLHGISIIMPDEAWSVTQFRNLAIRVIRAAWEKNYLPIVVGGTGFYHQQLFNNDPQLYIPPQNKIRSQAEQKTVKQLQAWLHDLDADKLAAMNRSDQHNPRRLIRAIEIAHALHEPGAKLKERLAQRPRLNQPDQYLSFGLKASSKALKSKIKQRVLRRFTSGAVQEVENLIALNLPPHNQAMSATGIEPIKLYLQHKQTAQQTLVAWTQQEYQYAHRQLTWWKQQISKHKEKLEEKNKKDTAHSQRQTVSSLPHWFDLNSQPMTNIKQEALGLINKINKS